jgi:ferritin-like metal-binding protein YciE
MENKNNEKLKNLLISELRDIYSAEQQIVEALPEAISAADNDELRKALDKHLNETRNQVKRLEKIFSMLNASAEGESCEAMEGLISEVKECIQKHEKGSLRDAALISKIQRIEHYEISVYGTMRTFAKELSLSDIKSLLQETLDEEGAADKALTKIAEGGLLTTGINRLANQ